MLKVRRTEYFFPEMNRVVQKDSFFFICLTSPYGFVAFDVESSKELWKISDSVEKPSCYVVAESSFFRAECQSRGRAGDVLVSEYSQRDNVRIQSFLTDYDSFFNKLSFPAVKCIGNSLVGKNYSYDLSTNELVEKTNYAHSSYEFVYNSGDYLIHDNARLNKKTGEVIWSLPGFVIMGADENFVVGAYTLSPESLCVFDSDGDFTHIEDLPEGMKVSFRDRTFKYQNGVLSGMFKGEKSEQGLFCFNVKEQKIFSLELDWESYVRCVSHGDYFYVQEIVKPRDYPQKATYLDIYDYELNKIDRKKIGKKEFDFLGFHGNKIILAEVYPNKRAREIIIAEQTID